MPPRVNNSSTSSTPVFEVKPLNNTFKYPCKGMEPWKNDMIIALIAPAASASKAGAFFNEKYNKTTIGIIALYQLTRTVSNNPCRKTSILLKSALPMSGDKKPNKMKDIKKAGIIVHVMFLICANKSTFNIDDAIFVVSESGDILSPKKAPETIAPAVIGSDTSVALDIPINATPMVPTVVKELPTLIPTIADTRNTIAKKNFG